MQDIEELMQLSIDGATTAEQEASLRSALTDPALRAKFESLQRLTRRLDHLPAFPSRTTKPAIMATIKERDTVAAPGQLINTTRGRPRSRAANFSRRPLYFNSNNTGGAHMSNPNRTRVLVGFGAAAVVLIVAVAVWPPSFRSEDASGAIGVVQKHRAPQITTNDVILGDEQTRAQQNVLYRDFFTDAQKLQSLASMVASRDEQAANIAKNADEMQSQLRSQYASEMQSALKSIDMAARQNGNKELGDRAEQLAQQASTSKLSARDMQEFNAKFASFEQLAAKSGDRVEMASHAIASALASRDEAQAASQIKAAEEQLSNVDFASIEFATREQYFANVEQAASALASAQAGSQDLAARMSSAELLAKQANALAHTALQNIEAQAASHVQTASALQEMQARVAGSRFSAELGMKLANVQQEFASRTSASLQSALASMQEFAASRSAKMSNVQMASIMANQEMASRFYGQLADTSEVAAAASNIANALHNQALANTLRNEAALAHQAEALASHKQ